MFPVQPRPLESTPTQGASAFGMGGSHLRKELRGSDPVAEAETGPGLKRSRSGESQGSPNPQPGQSCHGATKTREATRTLSPGRGDSGTPRPQDPTQPFPLGPYLRCPLGQGSLQVAGPAAPYLDGLAREGRASLLRGADGGRHGWAGLVHCCPVGRALETVAAGLCKEPRAATLCPGSGQT